MPCQGVSASSKSEMGSCRDRLNRTRLPVKWVHEPPSNHRLSVVSAREKDVDHQIRRIKSYLVLVRAVAETKTVVKSLLKHTEYTDFSAFHHVCSNTLGRQPSGKTLFTSNPTCGHPRYRRKTEILIQIPECSRHRGGEAFSFPIQFHHKRPDHSQKMIHHLLFIITINPMHFAPDPAYCFRIPFGVIRSDRHKFLIILIGAMYFVFCTFLKS